MAPVTSAGPVAERSVSIAVDELERYVQARIGGNHPAETTGKWAAAKFEHDSARPVDGYSAPQLHTHVVFFKVTKTADGKTRALQPQELFRSQKFATAVYQSELAWRLKRLGYEIDPGKNGAPKSEAMPGSTWRQAAHVAGRSASTSKPEDSRARGRLRSRRTEPAIPRRRSVRIRCSSGIGRSPPPTETNPSELWQRRSAGQSRASRAIAHRTPMQP
jgi:conjugative relaxase-like TrwC/TraI family protein